MSITVPAQRDDVDSSDAEDLVLTQAAYCGAGSHDDQVGMCLKAGTAQADHAQTAVAVDELVISAQRRVRVSIAAVIVVTVDAGAGVFFAYCES